MFVIVTRRERERARVRPWLDMETCSRMEASLLSNLTALTQPTPDDALTVDALSCDEFIDYAARHPAALVNVVCSVAGERLLRRWRWQDVRDDFCCVAFECGRDDEAARRRDANIAVTQASPQ